MQALSWKGAWYGERGLSSVKNNSQSLLKLRVSACYRGNRSFSVQRRKGWQRSSILVVHTLHCWILQDSGGLWEGARCPRTGITRRNHYPKKWQLTLFPLWSFQEGFSPLTFLLNLVLEVLISTIRYQKLIKRTLSRNEETKLTHFKVDVSIQRNVNYKKC